MTNSYRRTPSQGAMFLIGEGFATIFTSGRTIRWPSSHDEKMQQDIGLTRNGMGEMRRRTRR